MYLLSNCINDVCKLYYYHIREGISRKLVVKNLMWWGFLDNIIMGNIFISSVIFLKNLGALGLALAYIIAYVFKTIIFVPFYLWKECST